MMDPVDKNIESVYINNAAKLLMSDGVCVTTMVINNVSMVEVDDDSDDGVSCDVINSSLTLRESSLNRLPRQVTQVYVENSTIDALTGGTNNLRAFSLFNSDVNLLNISATPKAKGTVAFSAVLSDASVASFQRLYLGNGSSLLLENVTVQSMLSRGLVIDGGSVNMSDSSIIHASEESVVMSAGARLTLHKYAGDLKVTVDGSENMSEESTCSQCPPEGNHYFIQFLICLVLLIMAVFVIGFLVFYFCRPNASYQEKQSLYNLPQTNVHQITHENLKEEYEQPLLEEAAQITPSDSEHDDEVSVMISLEKLEELDSLKNQLLSLQQESKSELEKRKTDFEKEIEDLDQVVSFEISRLQEELNEEIDGLDGGYREDESVSDQDDSEASSQHTMEKVQDHLAQIIIEAKKKLLTQRFKAKMYDIEKNCFENKQKLREQLIEHKTEIIKQMIGRGRENLKNWINARDSENWTKPMTSDLDDHFYFLLKRLEEDFEFQTRKATNRYETESSLLEQKIRENTIHSACSYQFQNMNTVFDNVVIFPGSHEESTKEAIADDSPDFERDLYETKKTTYDLKHDLNSRIAQDEELCKLKTTHVKIVQDIQEDTIQDVQQAVEVIADVQKLYMSVMSQKLKMSDMDQLLLGSRDSIDDVIQIQYATISGESDASGISDSINL